VDIELTNEAVKQYRRLNEPALSRISEAIDELLHEPPVGDIKELRGNPGVYRLRVGSYRILYTLEFSCITIFKIAPRGQAYKE